MISFIRLLSKNSAIRAALILFIVLFGLPTFKAIATDASILPQGVTQFLDNDGNPLSTGKVYFYTPNTLTFKTTWQNAAKSVTNTNPVNLDAGGRAIIYGDGVYRQIVKDSAGTTIYDAVTTAPLTGSTATLVGDGNLVSTVLPWAGLVAPAQYVFGYGQEIARATYPDFFTATTSSQTVSCTLGSPLITGLADTTQIIVGTHVELSCVAAGTTVLSKTLTTATLSANSSASTTATAVFFPWGNGNGTTTFNVPDLRGYNLAGRDNMGGTASARLVNGNGLGRPLGIANFVYQNPVSTLFTTQKFTSGTGATYTPSAGVTNIVVRMAGPGGGGGASATNAGSAGSANTSFQVNATGTAWTAILGNGGATANGNGGSGGTGGTDGSTGTLVIRMAGGAGAAGGSTTTAATLIPSGSGGNTAFGGAGRGSNGGAGQNAAANSGAGGGGGAAGSAGGAGSGGGAGEYVEFWVPGMTTATYTIGAGGAGGVAGGNAGGNGAAGVIIVDEFYNTTATTTTSFTDTTAGTLQQVNTINYVVKVTPDTSISSATGVASLGGMTGVITCGTNVTCTGNTISIAPTQFYTTLIASAQSVNLNSANTDNAMTVTLPSGTTNYRITAIMVQNNGTTASLTTATAGLFSAAAGAGLALAANQALSAITANAVNTDANSLSLTQTIASRTVVNSAILYFRVGTAQGAASTANIYVYGQPMP